MLFHCRDLVKKLLVQDRTKRLGNMRVGVNYCSNTKILKSNFKKCIIYLNVSISYQ